MFGYESTNLQYGRILLIGNSFFDAGRDKNAVMKVGISK